MKTWKITKTDSRTPQDPDLKTGFRLLGVIPLILFLTRLLHFQGLGEPGQILWICHISNLLLAFGLFLDQLEFIRVSVLWLILGLPLWIWNMTQTGVGTLTTFVTHLGGLVVGLFALSRTRCSRRTWLYAVLWLLFVQQVSRVITPPDLNVNIAHRIYDGWETIFSAYWQYWLVTTILAGIGLWIIGIVLLNLWPPKQEVSDGMT